MGVFEVSVLGNERMYAKYLVLADSKNQAKELALQWAEEDFQKVHVKRVRELRKPRVLLLSELRGVA